MKTAKLCAERLAKEYAQSHAREAAQTQKTIAELQQEGADILAQETSAQQVRIWMFYALPICPDMCSMQRCSHAAAIDQA